MSKAPKKTPRKAITKRTRTEDTSPAGFDEVLGLIDAARARAVAAVNTSLIELYWSIGEHISRKIAEEGWGQGTVEELAEPIRNRHLTMRGFSARNLLRMRQFYETYRGQPKLSALLRELSWSHNLLIMSRCKRDEEREFYLRMATQERWSFRELERQLAGALFERVVLSPPKLSAPLTELHPDAAAIFKDSYLVEFARPSAPAFRDRLAARPGRAAQAVPDRAGPRLLLRRQPVPDPGWRARFRPRPALLQPGTQLPWWRSN